MGVKEVDIHCGGASVGMANLGDNQRTWVSSVPLWVPVKAGLLCLPRCHGHPAPFKLAQVPSWSGPCCTLETQGKLRHAR